MNSYLGQLKFLKNKYRAYINDESTKRFTDIKDVKTLRKDVKDSVIFLMYNFPKI